METNKLVRTPIDKMTSRTVKQIKSNRIYIHVKSKRIEKLSI